MRIQIPLIMQNYIDRHIQNFDKNLQPGKAVIILGPRRTGKTTLLKRYLENTPLKYRFETGDDLRIVELFETGDFSRIKEFDEIIELFIVVGITRLETGLGSRIRGISGGCRWFLGEHEGRSRILGAGTAPSFGFLLGRSRLGFDGRDRGCDPDRRHAADGQPRDELHGRDGQRPGRASLRQMDQGRRGFLER